MESHEEETDSVFDDVNNCDVDEQPLWEHDAAIHGTNIKLTESNSSGIIIDENESRKNSHGLQLSELEQQVEVAEARCGTLQQQLELMRLLCKTKFDEYTEVETCSESDDALKSPISHQYFTDDKLIQDHKTDNIISVNNSPDNEKSSSYLSDLSGLFFAAEQNFVEDLNNDYNQISSGPEYHDNHGDFPIYDYENICEEDSKSVLDKKCGNITCHKPENYSELNNNNKLEKVVDIGDICHSDNECQSENKNALKNYCDLDNADEYEKNYEIENMFEFENDIEYRNNFEFENNNEVRDISKVESFHQLENYCRSENNIETSLHDEEFNSLSQNMNTSESKSSYNLAHVSNNTGTEDIGIPSEISVGSECYLPHPKEANEYNNDIVCDDGIDNACANGKINPVQAIKGILNGLTDSVNIISKLSGNSSEKRKNRKKYPLGMSNAISQMSITTRTSDPPSDLEEGFLKFPANKPSSHTCSAKESHHLRKSHKRYQIPEQQMSDNIFHNYTTKLFHGGTHLKSTQLWERKKHSHNHRLNHSSHRLYHHDDDRHEFSTRKSSITDVHSLSDYKCRQLEDILDSCSVRRRHRHHKYELSDLNDKANLAIDGFSLKSYSRKKYHKKEKCERNFEDSNVWNDKTTNNSSNLNERSINSVNDDLYSVISLTKKKHKKQRKSKSVLDSEELEGNVTKNCIIDDHNSSSVKNETIHSEKKTDDQNLTNPVVASASKHKNSFQHSNETRTVKHTQISSVQSEKHLDHALNIHLSNGKCVNEPSCCVLSTRYESIPNFAVPTLSSRLKQNEKPVLQLFNFRNIPFVVGTSTSRSHNLALNLQQALSIIKLRNPSSAMTGDFNTDVASSILSHQSRPCSARSYVGHKSFCPVAMAQLKNSRYLLTNSSENISPDDKVDKIQNSDGDPPPGTFESLLKSQHENENIGGICFPELKQKENVWDVEQPDDTNCIQSKLRCTCFPNRPCIDYQKLLCEYISTGEDSSFLQMLLKSQDKHGIHHRTRSGLSGLNGNPEMSNIKENLEFGDENGVNPVYRQIQNHSKGLKDVLLSMHSEFLRLHNKYEQLQDGVEHTNGVEEAAKELAKLEAELEAKEDDIMDVMGLYKEMTSLKQQVKALREKTSSQQIISKSQLSQNGISREPTVSIRLTRLLRTIQKFQDKLLQD